MIVVSILLGFLAVARGTRLLTSDRLTVGYRQWVVRKFGPDSMPAYLAHCEWCTSIWVAAWIMPPAVLWPNRWVVAALAVLAASMVTGLLTQVSERLDRS